MKTLYIIESCPIFSCFLWLFISVAVFHGRRGAVVNTGNGQGGPGLVNLFSQGQ